MKTLLHFAIFAVALVAALPLLPSFLTTMSRCSGLEETPE